MTTTITVTCDMVEDCHEPIAFIDVKGYVYCDQHGKERKDTCRCRKLTPPERRQILAGEPLARY